MAYYCHTHPKDGEGNMCIDVCSFTGEGYPSLITGPVPSPVTGPIVVGGGGEGGAP